MNLFLNLRGHSENDVKGFSHQINISIPLKEESILIPKSSRSDPLDPTNQGRDAHVFPTSYTKLLLKEMVGCARLSATRGWHPGTAGNFSVRQDTSVCWLSPSGVDKGRLQIDDFLAISIENSGGKGVSSRRASAETPLHTAIYRIDTKACAVIHAHPANSVAMIQQSETFTGNEIIKAFGLPSHQDKIKIPCVPNTQDMDSLSASLEDFADLTSKVFVLQNHGIYAWGSSPGEALNRIEALEFLCQIKAIHDRNAHNS